MFAHRIAATELESLLTDRRIPSRSRATVPLPLPRGRAARQHLALFLAALTIGSTGVAAAASHDTADAATIAAVADTVDTVDGAPVEAPVPITLDARLDVATAAAQGGSSPMFQRNPGEGGARAGVLARLRDRFGNGGIAAVAPPVDAGTASAQESCDAPPVVVFHGAQTFDELMANPAPEVLEPRC